MPRRGEGCGGGGGVDGSFLVVYEAGVFSVAVAFNSSSSSEWFVRAAGCGGLLPASIYLPTIAGGSLCSTQFFDLPSEWPWFLGRACLAVRVWQCVFGQDSAR